MKKCIVVLGMHRSGTSLITKALEVLGVSLGTHLMPPAAHNEKGFWEDTEVVDLNDQLLAVAGMNWASIHDFPSPLFSSDAAVALKEKAKIIVARRMENTSLWGVKDPRLSRLLPFWETVFDDLGVERCYIYVIRNPLDVAASLQSRDHFKLSVSQHLWMSYNFKLLEQMRDKRVCFVSFDNFLSDPDKYMHRFAQSFGLLVDSGKLSYFRNEFMDRDLRHSRSYMEDLNAHAEIYPPVKKIYEILMFQESGRACPPCFSDDGWDALEKDYLACVSASLHRFCTAEQEKTFLLNTLSAQMNDMCAKYDAVREESCMRKKHIESLKNQMVALEEDIKVKTITLEVLEVDGRVRQDEIDHLKKQIAEIYNTRTWKLLKPLRDLRALVLKYMEK